MVERDITQYLIQRVRHANGLIYKLTFEGCSDCPDYVIFMNKKTVFVETKAPNKKPRESQLYVFSQIAINGHDSVKVISTKEQVDHLLNQLMEI